MDITQYFWHLGYHILREKNLVRCQSEHDSAQIAVKDIWIQVYLCVRPYKNGNN